VQSSCVVFLVIPIDLEVFMSRKFLIPVLSVTGIALVATLAFSGVALHQQSVANAAAPREADAAPQQQTITPLGIYVWSYAAKFVCGYQSPFPTPGTQLAGEPVFKPGNYATSITIHNPNYRGVNVMKKIVMLVDGRKPFVIREPEAVGRTFTDTLVLGPDFATMDDCNRIYAWTGSALPPFPAPVISGYLVVLSQTELDVDATYTAAAPGGTETPATGKVSPSQPSGLSIDEERVTGKRVFIPANVVVP
jgi:hypothetical protein